jgi:hypothetical protein
MRTITDTSWDFATRSSLYHVWVPLHDDGKAPLVSIWIDPALTAFRSLRQETTANPLTGQEANDADPLAAEHVTSILERGS